MSGSVVPSRPRASVAALAVILSVGLAAAPALAAEIEATSAAIEAVVYPRGAQVTRQARFAAPPGRHEVVIADLPDRLDGDSLRVAGSAQATETGGGFEILGIAYRRVQPRLEPLSEPERQALLDRIEAKEWDLRAAEDAVAEARERVEYMRAFRAATVGQRPFFGRGERRRERDRAGEGERERRSQGGSRGGSLFETAESWRDAWALIGAEASAARDALRGAERDAEAEREALDALRDALDQAGPPPPARNVLTVSIAAPNGVEGGALEIEYVTPEARWAPLYDLKLDTAAGDRPGLAGALEISRLATVSQSTGEPWAGVSLSLSTARASGGVAARPPRPQLAALVPLAPPGGVGGGLLSRDAAPAAEDESRLRGAFNRADAPAPEPLAAQIAGAPPREATRAAAFAQTSGAGVVYEIRDPVAIPGDGEPRQVLIGVETSEVELVARATPKLDETAYLYALRENGPAPLLPGRASIYRDGVFHGQFDLAYVAPNTDSALPFGRLDGVTVDHVVRTQTTGEGGGLFSSSNRQQSRFALTAKNNGETPRRITLLDVTPYSETEEIEVTYQGPAPTERNVEGARGVIAWTFDLAPGGERKIAFGYDVSWPEGREIRIRPAR